MYCEFDLDVCSALQLHYILKYYVLAKVCSSTEGGKSPTLIAMKGFLYNHAIPFSRSLSFFFFPPIMILMQFDSETTRFYASQ